jgi:hypothetical protein
MRRESTMERNPSEVPEADALEQRQPAADEELERDEVTDAAEVPDTDAREQAEPARLDAAGPDPAPPDEDRQPE